MFSHYFTVFQTARSNAPPTSSGPMACSEPVASGDLQTRKNCDIVYKEELFITGNLLLSGVSWQLGFNQSLIWQIDKQSGYNGLDSLNYAVWSDIKDDSIMIRNIHPVRGARGLQSKEQYFLSNKNFSIESDTLYFMKISNTLNSDSAEFTIERLSLSEHYFLSPNP